MELVSGAAPVLQPAPSDAAAQSAVDSDDSSSLADGPPPTARPVPAPAPAPAPAPVPVPAPAPTSRFRAEHSPEQIRAPMPAPKSTAAAPSASAPAAAAAAPRWCKKCAAVFVTEKCPGGHPIFQYTKKIPAAAAAGVGHRLCLVFPLASQLSHCRSFRLSGRSSSHAAASSGTACNPTAGRI